MSPHLKQPFGTTLIGNILASVLFGVITVQTRFYFSRFARDLYWIKSMVVFLWSLQCIQVVLTSRGLYRQSMASRHASSAGGPPPIWFQWDYYFWSIQLCTSTMVAQLFFSYRLWTLSQRRIPNYLITSLVFANGTFGFSIIIRVYASNGTKLAPLLAAIIYSATSVMMDISLAISVASALQRHRTGFLQTDRALNRIILYGVATGALTSLFAIAMLICAALGERAAVRVLGVPHGAVQTVCVLAHLHSRAGLRSRISGECRLPTGVLSSIGLGSRPLRAGDTNPSTLVSTTPSYSTGQIDATIVNELANQQNSPLSVSSSPSIPFPSVSIVQVTRTIETLDDRVVSDRSPRQSHSAPSSPLRRFQYHFDAEPFQNSYPSTIPLPFEVTQDNTIIPPLAPPSRASTLICHAPTFNPTALFAEGLRPRSRSQNPLIVPMPLINEGEVSLGRTTRIPMPLGGMRRRNSGIGS
ncbi:hypothetical protein DL93DRAFT_2230771 [Clavulina sp. PMI_390]|nr:hypothetical protein DL93DRAFT_2230771 [Clavulina sp. PMI_390]